MAGVRQISPIHFEVARNYEAGPWRTLTHVVLPGSLPLILAGCRVALNSAVVVTIAVELAQSRDGIGHLLWIAGETLRVEELYAAVAVAAILGVFFNFLLRFLSRWLVPWQTEHQI
jgi:NitT/TauT family transport system permease protein